MIVAHASIGITRVVAFQQMAKQARRIHHNMIAAVVDQRMAVVHTPQKNQAVIVDHSEMNQAVMTLLLLDHSEMTALAERHQTILVPFHHTVVQSQPVIRFRMVMV